MSLETRLLTYDWRHHFPEFQLATQRGSFRPRCWNANYNFLPVSHVMFFFYFSLLFTHHYHNNISVYKIIIVQVIYGREI